jgi:hypothetical protein
MELLLISYRYSCSSFSPPVVTSPPNSSWGTTFRRSISDQPPPTTGATTTNSTTTTTSNKQSSASNVVMSAADQIKMERLVATASHNFGMGLQSIVLSAKAKQPVSGTTTATTEWKSALLQLLGQQPIDQNNNSNSNNTNDTTAQPKFTTPTKKERTVSAQPPIPQSDIDVLIQNSSCTNFILRCI